MRPWPGETATRLLQTKHAAVQRRIHLTHALAIVAVTAPLVVIMGTPRYTHTPSGTREASGARREKQAQGAHYQHTTPACFPCLSSLSVIICCMHAIHTIVSGCPPSSLSPHNKRLAKPQLAVKRPEGWLLSSLASTRRSGAMRSNCFFLGFSCASGSLAYLR